jgi:S-adenosyl-L-methionine hydrolase (adenosine-forming)
VTHEIPPYNVELGAFQLMRAYRYFPRGTFHLAVVDPGVGSARRCLYVRTAFHHFVGPDNGVLLWAVRDAEKREGRPASVYEIPVPEKIGATFHGRDVFAPFISKALRKPPKRMRKVPGMAGREFPACEKSGDGAVGEIVAADRFGNLVTSLPDSFLPAEATVGGKTFGTAPNYQSIESGESALIRGSHGFWEIACREASAQDRLHASKGVEVTFKFSVII